MRRVVGSREFVELMSFSVVVTQLYIMVRGRSGPRERHTYVSAAEMARHDAGWFPRHLPAAMTRAEGNASRSGGRDTGLVKNAMH